jgi:peptidoglycan/xylan/chitin deacetylase (PgdA/CDA1 family)
VLSKSLEMQIDIEKFLYFLPCRIFGTITHVNTCEPVVSLTFDDGPHPVYTPLLLKILDKHGVHATFFMVGEAAQRYRNIVEIVERGGHVIGTHSWDHSSFTSISSKERRKQLRASKKIIAPSGHRLFRPPWGNQSLSSRIDALLFGYEVIGWNVVAEDWLDLTADTIAERLIKTIRPGSIVLLHDAIYKSIFDSPQHDRTAMLDAVDTVLERLCRQFSFVTIPELFRFGKPIKQNWFKHTGDKCMT